MSENTTRGHVREHGSLLAGVEKRALIWIAERLPRAINSDHLTVLGLAAMAVAGGAFWASRWFEGALVVVVLALAVNWFGDSLDGTVARVRNQQRPMYGFYVDHVIDIVGALFLFGGLALSPYMTPEVALTLLVAYLMISAEAFLATHACGVFRVSLFKVGPTELRILLAIGALYLYYKPTVVLAGSEYLLFDVGGVVATIGMFGALTFSAARNTLALYRAEPMPAAAPRRRDSRPVPAAGGLPVRERTVAGPSRTVQRTRLGNSIGTDRRWGGRRCGGAPSADGSRLERLCRIHRAADRARACGRRGLSRAGLRPRREGRARGRARRGGSRGPDALARSGRREHRRAEGRHPPLARQHLRSRCEVGRGTPRRSRSTPAGGPAGGCSRVARARARRRPRSHLSQAQAQEVRHRPLQHRARDALRAARHRPSLEQQRGDEDCRSSRTPGRRTSARSRSASTGVSCGA